MNKGSIQKQSGQALVEFVILLTVIMALCSGMLYVSRLLDLHFWASQEAKILGFEQEWFVKMGVDEGIADADVDLDDHARFRRPRSARDAAKNRELDTNINQAGMNDVIASLSGFEKKVIAAAHPFFSRDLESESDGIDYEKEESGFVAPAYAAQVRKIKGSGTSLLNPVPPKLPKLSSLVGLRSNREQKFSEILEIGGFGERICTALNAVAYRYNRVSPYSSSTAECKSYFNHEFGNYLAEHTNFPELFRDYGYQLGQGYSPQEGLKSTTERAVAQMFYSFFDERVREVYTGNDARDFIDEQSDDKELVPDHATFTRMGDDARYLGAEEALDTIEDVINQLGGYSANSNNFRTPQGSIALRNALEDVLYEDASDDFSALVLNGFLFKISNFFPLPDMSSIIGGLFDAVAYNVFSEESALQDQLIDQSSIYTEVTYDPTNVTFSAAKSRFATSGRTLSYKFYVLTQPWHVTRRDNEQGGHPFRDLGTQFDDKDDDSTEEAMLRRRVFGLYIIPSELTDLLRPLSGVFPFVDTVADILDPVDSVVKIAKNFILDNPINDLMSGIEDFTGGAADLSNFKLPEWPAVRPQAYPLTTEIKNDFLAGEERVFDDYVKEQRDNDPEPEPDFHED